jgi:hypothetical protein
MSERRCPEESANSGEEPRAAGVQSAALARSRVDEHVFLVEGWAVVLARIRRDSRAVGRHLPDPLLQPSRPS